MESLIWNFTSCLCWIVTCYNVKDELKMTGSCYRQKYWWKIGWFVSVNLFLIILYQWVVSHPQYNKIPKYFYNFIFVQFVTFPLFNKLLLYQFSLFKCISSVNFSFLLKTTKKEKRSFIYGLWAIYVPMWSTTSFLLNIIISLIVFEPYTTVSQLHYFLLTITNVTPDYQ